MEGKRTEEEDPLHLLAEGMRQLQLAYLGRSEKDSDVKGNVEVPMMPEVGTERVPLNFRIGCTKRSKPLEACQIVHRAGLLPVWNWHGEPTMSM